MRPLVRDRLLARALAVVPPLVGTLLWSATRSLGVFPGVVDLLAATIGFGVIMTAFLRWPALRFEGATLVVPASLLGSLQPPTRLRIDQIHSVKVEPPRGRADPHARFPLSVFLEVESERGVMRGHVPKGEKASALLVSLLGAARRSADLPGALFAARDPGTRP